MTGLHLFGATDRRVQRLRAALIASTMSGMLFCIPLWLGTREYPLVPMLPSGLDLPTSCGPWLLGLTLASLMAAIWFFRPAAVLFLAATFYLYCCDQNRGQPWMYMYWVMLLLNLLPEQIAFASCRLALSVVYFWAGVQKLNDAFFTTIPPWFVQPAAEWGFPHAVVALLGVAVALTPLLEISISLGVWFSKTRWLAVAIAVTLHAASLLFLGPLGHDLNLVVWPWNIAMIALALVLFATKECASLPDAWRELRHSLGARVIVGLFGLLPILSFFGYWDSYFSFALYSANTAQAEVYLSGSSVARLPERLRAYVYPVTNFNPASPYQLRYMFEPVLWGTAVLGVPPVPEPRGYAVMFRYIGTYATNKDQCWMLVKTRTGRILMDRPGTSRPSVLE